MADSCVYCGLSFDAPVDRCPECRRGQPVEVEPLPRVATPTGGVPGSLVFMVGAILIVVGVFVPFVMLVGLGLRRSRSPVWSRLEHEARPAE